MFNKEEIQKANIGHKVQKDTDARAQVAIMKTLKELTHAHVLQLKEFRNEYSDGIIIVQEYGEGGQVNDTMKKTGSSSVPAHDNPNANDGYIRVPNDVLPYIRL